MELGWDHGEHGVERVAILALEGQVTKLCPEASPPAREHASARSLACTSETSEHLEPQFIGEAAEPVLPIGVATPGTGPRHASSRRRHRRRDRTTAGQLHCRRGSSTVKQDAEDEKRMIDRVADSRNIIITFNRAVPGGGDTTPAGDDDCSEEGGAGSGGGGG